MKNLLPITDPAHSKGFSFIDGWSRQLGTRVQSVCENRGGRKHNTQLRKRETENKSKQQTGPVAGRRRPSGNHFQGNGSIRGILDTCKIFFSQKIPFLIDMMGVSGDISSPIGIFAAIAVSGYIHTYIHTGKQNNHIEKRYTGLRAGICVSGD